MFTPDDIRRYYDANTASFVRRSQAGAEGAIHRAVWGPEVSDRAGAFRYLDDLVAGQIATLETGDCEPHVLDLGCGIGASLVQVARRVAIRGTGVTLSPVQARLGAAHVEAAGFAGRLRIVEGDYTALPPSIGDVDLAYAIESFVHGPSPERFFAEAARVLRPGGRLIVCDDVRRATGEPAAARTIARFTRGWHVNSLLTREALRGAAAAAGLRHEQTIDLTPYLELGRGRDRAVAVLAGLIGWLPVRSAVLGPLLGGHALQQALRRGWLAFEFAVFRR